MAFDNVTFFELHLDTPIFGGTSTTSDDPTDTEMEPRDSITIDEMDVDADLELAEPRSGGNSRIALLATLVGAVATLTLARRLRSRGDQDVEDVDEIGTDDVDQIDVDIEAPIEQ